MIAAVRAVLSHDDKDDGRKASSAVIDRFHAEHGPAGLLRLIEVSFAENTALYARLVAVQAEQKRDDPPAAAPADDTHSD